MWMIARGNPRAHWIVNKDGQAACGFYRRRGHGWQRPWSEGEPRCRLCEEVLCWLPQPEKEALGNRDQIAGDYLSDVSGFDPEAPAAAPVPVPKLASTWTLI